MKDWEKYVEEKPAEAHDRQVLASMDSLLDQNAAMAAGARGRTGLFWLFWFAPAASAMAAIAFFVLTGTPLGTNEPGPTLAAASPMLELAIEFDLLTDLRELQHLEELQKLGEPDTWTAKSSGTRKL